VQGTISLQLMADRLIEAARDGGGSDNITVLLLRFEEMSWFTKFFRWLFGGGSSRKWQESI
jgi:serine/threonine protein phosphatase PrpC